MPHDGTYNKLRLYVFALRIKARVISWDQLMYATVEKGRHQAFQPVLRSVFCLFATPQTFADQKFIVVEKHLITA